MLFCIWKLQSGIITLLFYILKHYMQAQVYLSFNTFNKQICVFCSTLARIHFLESHNKDYETGNPHLLVGLGSLHSNNNRSYEMRVKCPICRAEFSNIRNVATENITRRWKYLSDNRKTGYCDVFYARLITEHQAICTCMQIKSVPMRERES